MSTKTCSKCGAEKDFSLFYYVKGKPGSWCKACHRASCASYANTQEGRAKIRAARSTDAMRQKKSEQDRAYREANREALAAKKRAYYLANKQRQAERLAAAYAQNPDKYKQRSAEWKKNNSAAWNAKCMVRYAAKLNATPPWLSDDDKWMMEEAYELAKLRERVCGGKWHVDHIVPLRGETVNGLHVPWNLQVIPASVNCSKRNSLR